MSSPPNTSELQTLELEAWSYLEQAVERASDAFRYLTIANVDEMNKPQARVLVLRAVDPACRLLEFHTDIRSAKWQDLVNDPHATVLGYDPDRQLQLRFDGTVELFGLGVQAQSEAWDKLSVWSRRTYCGGMPGEILAVSGGGSGDVFGQNNMEDVLPEVQDVEQGKQHLGVMRFSARRLDWLALERPVNRRAKFQYDANNGKISMTWVIP